MAVVALVVFGLLRLTPGDPAAVIAGDYTSPQDVASHERFATRHGFEFPLLADTDKTVGGEYGTLGPIGFYRRSVFVVDPLFPAPASTVNPPVTLSFCCGLALLIPTLPLARIVTGVLVALRVTFTVAKAGMLTVVKLKTPSPIVSTEHTQR